MNKQALGDKHGFLVSTAMDTGSLDSIRFVLAALCAQAQENKKARSLARARALHAAVVRRIFLFVAPGSALWLVRRAFRSRQPNGRVAGRRADRRRRSRGILGPLAPRRQLEWSGHLEGRPRIDSPGALPHHPPSDLHRNPASAPWHRGGHRRSTCVARRGRRLAIFLLKGAPRRIVPLGRIRPQLRRAPHTHRNVLPAVFVTVLLLAKRLPCAPPAS